MKIGRITYKRIGRESFVRVHCNSLRDQLHSLRDQLPVECRENRCSEEKNYGATISFAEGRARVLAKVVLYRIIANKKHGDPHFLMHTFHLHTYERNI